MRFAFGSVLIWLVAIVLPPPVANAALPLRFHQEDSGPLSGLIGSDIGDIRWSDRHLWVGTENGLARLDLDRFSGLDGSDWITFTEANGLGRGAVSALAASGDTVWVATIVDTLITGLGQHQMGTGISWSLDAGKTWSHISNEELFALPGFNREPPIDNGCFSIDFVGDTVWAAFFSGSLVKSPDGGQNWKRVLPGGAEEIYYFEDETGAEVVDARADSLDRAGAAADTINRIRAEADSLRSLHLLHRTFEVLAYGDTLWVGTSSGVARSFDGGTTWRNHKVRVDRDGNLLPGNPGGNWVITLERQITTEGRSVIWAGTRVTDNPATGQVNSISYSLNNGESWQKVGPTYAWGFAFTENRVWAGTNQGLLTSFNEGVTWDTIAVEDATTREQLRGTFVGMAAIEEILWVGSEIGLGRTTDEGATWRIVKSPVKTLSLDTGQFMGNPNQLDTLHTLSAGVRSYAAPNPFSPTQGELARINYSLDAPAEVSIELFDFASRRVRRLLKNEARRGQDNHGENWDGRDDDGDIVANGVYFYRIEVAKGKSGFGKVVVLD